MRKLMLPVNQKLASGVARKHSPFRAFAHPNFRLYIVGQGASIIGTWMQQVAMAWLVYQLTGSAFWLGLVACASQIPALILTPLAGCLIDVHDRRRLLYLTQGTAMLQALVLAILTITGAVEPWHILALSFLLGAVNALDIPTRQSLLNDLVDKGPDLANAIAINSSVFNGARVVGPALAGIVLMLTSPGICFLANALSYLAVLAALRAMRLTARATSLQPRGLLKDLREGLSYAWSSKPIRSLLLLIGAFNIAGMAETTLLPIVAQAVLSGDASTLALLSAAAGLGAFLAALFLASRRDIEELQQWIAVTPAIYGLAMLAFSFADHLAAAAFLLTVTGFTLLFMTAASNTILQTIVHDDKRGRIVSLYTTMVTGLAPIGGLIAGVMANHIGASLTFRAFGLACVGASLPFAASFLRKRIWATGDLAR